MDLNPDDPWLSFNLGDALEENGDEESAVRAYEAAISLPNAKNNLAGLLEKSGDHDRAEALYAECCQQSPDDYDFAVNRACCARSRGAEDAEALFAEAATLSERPYACSFNLAELAAARGDIQTALARAKEAVAYAVRTRLRTRRNCRGAPRGVARLGRRERHGDARHAHGLGI